MAIKKIRGMESDFVILPNSALNDSLSWSAKGLLAYLCAKPDNWTVSTQQLINHSALSARPTARDGTYAIINELLDKGYMKRSKTTGEGYSKTDYEVCAKPLPSNPDQDNPLVDEPTLQSKELKQSKEIKQTYSVIDGLFSEFWDMYDKKTGLDKCKQKFKKLSKTDQELIFTLLPAYIQSTPDKQYRKNPLTWLNGKHWNDEITTPVSRSPESSTGWSEGMWDKNFLESEA
ncbi:MAG: hypothetical protein JKY50_00705 [Oleispira sp.]|nr:hypothetical protein [Oleispira sp.]